MSTLPKSCALWEGSADEVVPSAKDNCQEKGAAGAL